MKKLFVLLILLLSFGRSQAADIEARTGILGGDGWGLQTGAYINFPQSRLFSIQTGLLLNLRLNAGAYTGSGEYWNLGATAAAGIEVKRFYVGVNYFQNCVNDRDLKLGLSVGYKFTLF